MYQVTGLFPVIATSHLKNAVGPLSVGQLETGDGGREGEKQS